MSSSTGGVRCARREMESPQRSHPSLRYTAIAKLSPIDASPSEAPSTGRTDQTMRHPQAASIIHANTSAFTELPLQVLMKFERQSALVPPARFPCDQERDRRGGAGTWRMAPPRVATSGSRRLRPPRGSPATRGGTARGESRGRLGCLGIRSFCRRLELY